MARHLTVDPKRLFEAADALLDAMRSPDGGDGLVPMHVAADAEPPPGSFRPGELVEAMSMLIRLGFTASDG